MNILQKHSIKTELFGRECPWMTEVSHLTPESVVYSFGIGEDISWDIDLIEKFGVTVNAFDPTPNTIKWLKGQKLPDRFIFHPYGLDSSDREAVFYTPVNKLNVSYTIFPRRYVDTNKKVIVPMKRLSTFMKELGHDRIDIIKMDIEGSEFLVFWDIKSLIFRGKIRQILVEFHGWSSGFFGWKKRLTILFLWLCGYSLYYKKNGDFCFIKRS